jgi:hypothetical protein
MPETTSTRPPNTRGVMYFIFFCRFLTLYFQNRRRAATLKKAMISRCMNSSALKKFAVQASGTRTSIRTRIYVTPTVSQNFESLEAEHSIEVSMVRAGTSRTKLMPYGISCVAHRPRYLHPCSLKPLPPSEKNSNKLVKKRLQLSYFMCSSTLFDGYCNAPHAMQNTFSTQSRFPFLFLIK